MARRFLDPITFRPLDEPLDDWIPATAERPSSQFSSTYRDTLVVLRDELGRLGTREAFLRLVADAGQIRQDGQLRANARVDHPGVSLTIVTDENGTLVYSTDVFGPRWGLSASECWIDNLRAITLGLHDLRRLDRYGIAKRGQQYAGFREIGSGHAMPAASVPMNERRARDVLGLESSEPVDRELLRRLKRDAAKHYHPDTAGEFADPAKLQQIVEAADYMETEVLR